MMWQDLRNHPSALLISAGIHVVVLLLLVITFHPSAESVNAPLIPQPNIVEAVAIDGEAYDEALQRKADAERQQREAEQRRQREAEERVRQEQARREAETRKAREAEQQRLAAEKARAEQQRQAAEKARLEQQRAAEEKARLERQRREAEAQKAREAQQRAEQERIAAMMAAEEAAIREAEKRREAELAAQRQAQRAAQLQRLTDSYLGMIKAHVESRWERPLGAGSNQRAVVVVRQARGGYILEVKLRSCEGTDAFCRSVVDAVWRSEPLPMPPAEELFEEEIVFNFDPDRP